jgi:hypothetical protein
MARSPRSLIVYNPAMHNATVIRALAGILLTSAIAGCRSEKPKLDQLPADSRATTMGAPDTASTVPPDVSAWKVSVHGFGPLRAGMSAGQVQSLLPRLQATGDLNRAECTYARSSLLPPGVVLMFAKGSLARVDVLSGRAQTDLGARLGDTEDQVAMLYGRSLKVSPHKYTEGHYLTVQGESADSIFRIVFETDGSRVLRYRSGRIPEVEWVEGCG